MMHEKNTQNTFNTEFNILGQNIVIKNKEAAALAEQAFVVVHQKLQAIQNEKALLGPLQVAVLALLEIASELVKDRQATDAYRAELDRKCTALMNDLERNLSV